MNAYLNLLQCFSEGRISAGEFESIFLVLFKNDPGERPEPVFNILDELFGDVDSYSPIPGPGYLTADELRSRASGALAVLLTISSE